MKRARPFRPCRAWHDGDGAEHIPCVYARGHGRVRFGDADDLHIVDHANPRLGVGWNGDGVMRPRQRHIRPLFALIATLAAALAVSGALLPVAAWPFWLGFAHGIACGLLAVAVVAIVAWIDHDRFRPRGRTTVRRAHTGRDLP